MLPLDQQLCFSLYGASMAVSRAYKPLLDGLGLTYPQYLVLHALWESDGRGVGAIAARLALEPSTVTPLVTRLERAGAVRRERDPADDRRSLVRLTDKGRALREACGCLGEAMAARSGMTAEALQRLNREVQALRDAVAAGSSGAVRP